MLKWADTTGGVLKPFPFFAMPTKDYIREVAIAAVTILMCYSMYLGQNGVIFSGVIAVIAGIAGYKIRDKFDFGKWIG